MASFNKIIIVGYLGRDPELRYTPQGTAICNFSVATTEKRKQDGEDVERTTWFRVKAWGKQGELCNEYLSKGSQVYLEGKLTLEEFTDREGLKRTTLEVNLKEFQFLDRKGDRGGDRGGEGAGEDFPISRPKGGHHESPEEKQSKRNALKTPPARNAKDEIPEDDDIPF